MVQPGTLLEGKYEILDKIREGGMGSIYRVRHRLLEEVRVVKVMKPSAVADADLRRRFVEEARTATRLKHPNICTIYDFAIDDSGMAYLVMEYIEGPSVADLLRLQGRPALPLALEIAHQSLLALGFLHRKGIVHRDVAPDNIMLTRDEQGLPLVKVIDLGIAKVAEGPIEATATGVFLGKLKYASPEQYGALPKGQRLDGRSDLYGLGVVLYEILTGVLPFEGDTVVELLRAHVFAPPRPFSQSDPEGRVPAELRGAILKSLQKRREDRYATAEDFDREVLTIRERFVRPEDLEATRAAVATLRPSREIHVLSATPSAQSHLDRQFGASGTPTPARSTENDLTAAAPASVPWTGREADVPTVPTEPGRVRRRPAWLLPAVRAGHGGDRRHRRAVAVETRRGALRPGAAALATPAAVANAARAPDGRTDRLSRRRSRRPRRRPLRRPPPRRAALLPDRGRSSRTRPLSASRPAAVPPRRSSRVGLRRRLRRPRPRPFACRRPSRRSRPSRRGPPSRRPRPPPGPHRRTRTACARPSASTRRRRTRSIPTSTSASSRASTGRGSRRPSATSVRRPSSSRSGRSRSIRAASRRSSPGSSRAWPFPRRATSSE